MNQFFNTLYHQIPDDHVVTTFHIPVGITPLSFSLYGLESLNFSHATNLYFEVCTSIHPNKRHKSDEICGAPGLWCDFDVKKGAFESRTEIFEFLANLECPPSLTVSSGGGVHAYWVFKKYFMVHDTESKSYLESLCQNWQAYLRRESGKAIDSTHDAARCLRVPGSKYVKNGIESTVDLIGISDRRYTLEELTIEAPVAKTTTKPKHTPTPTPMVIERKTIDDTRLVVLLANNPTFLDTWNHTRTDLSDQSMSTYDMAIAKAVMGAGFSANDASDLVKLHRESWLDASGKSERIDYIQRTVEKSDTAGLGIDVQNVLKYGKSDPQYELLLTNGERIPIGNIKNLDSQTALRRKIREFNNIRVPNCKKSQFEPILDMLYSKMIECEVNEREEIWEWVEQCVWADLSHSREDAIIANRALLESNSIYVSSSQLLAFCRQNKIQVTRTKLNQMLTQAGGEHVRLSQKIEGVLHQRYFYKFTADQVPLAVAITRKWSNGNLLLQQAGNPLSDTDAVAF